MKITTARKETMMGGQGVSNVISLEEALKAQGALRDLAGLGPEEFPLQAFVGMISDEVEMLRKLGHSDEQIADVIKAHSQIEITAAELSEHYASPEQRHGGHD